MPLLIWTDMHIWAHILALQLKKHLVCFKRLPADTRSLTMAPATRFSGSPLSSSGGSWFEINTPKLGLPTPIYKSGSIEIVPSSP